MKINLLILLFTFFIISCDDENNTINDNPDIEGEYFKFTKSEVIEANKLFDSLDGKNWIFKSGWPMIEDSLMKLSYLLNIKGIKAFITDSVFVKDSTIYTISISSINLSYNDLEGLMPEINLDNLDTLNLGNNDIYGNIPDINLPKLSFINFSHNKFDGEVPNFSSKILRYIDINYNFLVGSLPNLDMENLVALDVSSNNLSGNLDNLKLPSLELLSIANNDFEGIITQYNFPNLRTLKLSNNKFTGELHGFIENPLLQVLDISDNQLEGNLQSLTDKKLNHLNLANNNLSGDIPLFTQSFDYQVINEVDSTLKDTTALYMQNLYVGYNNFNFKNLEANAELIYNYSYESQNYELVLEDKGNNILSAKMEGEFNIYQWYKDGKEIEGETNIEIVATTSGSFYCIVGNTKLGNLKFQSNTLEIE